MNNVSEHDGRTVSAHVLAPLAEVESIASAAHRLDRTPWDVVSLIDGHELRAVRFNGMVLVSRVDVDALAQMSREVTT